MATIKKLSQTLLTNDTRSCLLTSALEGGSNYWLDLPKSTWDKIKKYKVVGDNNYISDLFLRAIEGGETLDIIDVEDENEILGTISLKSMRKGEKTMIKDYTQHFAAAISEGGDAETGDVYLQLCIFNDVVYG